MARPMCGVQPGCCGYYSPVRYREGYKYQVAEDLTVQTDIRPDKYIRTKFITLSKRGKLTIKAGYAWDGASGPTVDTESTITPSCVHDALYQLMRLGLLGQEWRNPADRLLRKMLVERGMWRIRAWYWYRGLQVADGDAALPENKQKVLEAP